MQRHSMRVAFPFEFNGSEFRHGKVRFAAPEMAKVEDVNFNVPSRFALLLLRDEQEAWGLLEQVAAAPLKPDFKTELLGKAASEGVNRICVEPRASGYNASPERLLHA